MSWTIKCTMDAKAVYCVRASIEASSQGAYSDIDGSSGNGGEQVGKDVT